MSTRACYIFKDENDTCAIYIHADGYPTGAAEYTRRALQYAWELPRWEADEFGAAMIVAAKTHNGKPLRGNARLMAGAGIDSIPGDIEYLYIFEGKSTGHNFCNSKVSVSAYAVDLWDKKGIERSLNLSKGHLFTCDITQFGKRAKIYENQQRKAA